MARSALRDPLDKYRWTVTIEGFSKVGFHETSSPGYNITNKKYKEGGAHLTPRQIIDTVDYKPVTLTRGVTNDTSFNKWATAFNDLVTNNSAFNDSTQEPTSFGGLPVPGGILGGVVNGALNGGASPVQSFVRANSLVGEPSLNYRKKVKIEHTNRAGQVEVTYILYGAFPIEYTPASDFNAMSDDTVSIESITLGYESFEVLYAGLAGAAANLIASNT